MRLSAVLVAVFTASATLGLSNSATGQTLPPDLTDGEATAPEKPPKSPAGSLTLNEDLPAFSQPSGGFSGAASEKPALNVKAEAVKSARLSPAKSPQLALLPLQETAVVKPEKRQDPDSEVSRILALQVSSTSLAPTPEASERERVTTGQTEESESTPATSTPVRETAISPTQEPFLLARQVAGLKAEGKLREPLAQASPQAEETPPPAEIPVPAEQTPPRTPPPPTLQLPASPPSASEPQGLVAEVFVSGVEGELQDEVYRAISTQPGRSTTRSQLQQDINAVFATGFFRNVRAVPEDTPLGVRVTFFVEPNPVLRSVQVTGQQVLPQAVIDEAFSAQYGQILNLRRFEEGVQQINKWYQDNGYVLGQVTDAPQVSEDGTVTLAVAEGTVESVDVRFLNKEGETTDAKGEPIRGNTREFIITREVELKPGDVFNRTKAERDLRRVFNLGIFEDVRLSLEPGQQDPRKARVIVNVIEKSTGSLGAGAGISSASGLFGTVSYQQQNLGGNNQRLGTELQIGERSLLFDVSFTDPWIAGDPYRTSYTVNGFRRRSLSVIFDGGKREVTLPNGDRPRILRTGGGISFTRPLSRNPYVPAEWTASVGLQYQHIQIRDRKGRTSPRDEEGNRLAFSNSGEDDLLTLQAGISRDLRDDNLRPTRGSLLRFGMEQSVPIGGIFFNRIRGSYSYYLPVRYTNFAEGPQTLAFNVQAGTILGDLPPYEAFALGGANSIRGYDEGDVGAGRSFLQATVEYRFPIISFVGGAFFLDVGTDLGTGSSVPGNPAGVRRKPGSGFGYGLGIRVQSPLGPIRIDYGMNDEGDSRIHFGLGERF